MIAIPAAAILVDPSLLGEGGAALWPEGAPSRLRMVGGFVTGTIVPFVMIAVNLPVAAAKGTEPRAPGARHGGLVREAEASDD